MINSLHLVVILTLHSRLNTATKSGPEAIILRRQNYLNQPEKMCFCLMSHDIIVW